MITIQGSQNIASIERYLTELEVAKNETDVRLPTSLTEERAGGKAALIQAIITWAKHTRTGRLVTRIGASRERDIYLQNLSATEHGLVTLLMARDIVAGNDTSLSHPGLQQAYSDYRNVSFAPRAVGTRCLFLVSNRFSRAETPNAYESIAGTLAPGKGEWFKKEVARQVNLCISRSPAKSIPPTDCAAIGEIAYELFANAEEWGSSEFDGSTIFPNVRGIIIEVHGKARASRTDLLQDVSGSPPMEQFVKDWYERSRVLPAFLELSIFDSGVGLAQRAVDFRLTEETDLEREYKLVLDCLRKYSSSSHRGTRGLGLYYVMSLLTKTRGFLRYRSGRLSLFRDFNTHQFMPELGHDQFVERPTSKFKVRNIFLFDWKSQSPTLVRFPRVDGALFTMLFPLMGADEQMNLP